MSDRQFPDVSRETFERLKIYEKLICKWNPKINLVSKSTLPDLWGRHFQDSAQLYDLVPHPVERWLDLGSGGGFPGLIIAILAAETKSPAKVTLIESDARKCAFLRTVARETGVSATVINARIDEVPAQYADVISARALTALPGLLEFTELHGHAQTISLFPKGVGWKKEIETAETTWRFQFDVANSQTESGPVILKIAGVARV